MPLGPGSRLDTYELVDLLGRGGMGDVWLARDTTLGRSVALKLLSADLTTSGERVARFEQEARLASALSHPNVCHVYGLGRAPDGQRFIAMELVEGQTLRARLREPRLRLREVLDIGVQIAAGVNAAHAAGIVHRDLKPENVMIRPDGLVKVLDFGLAKLAPAATDLEQNQATRTVVQTDAGVVMGTIAYMSPEQARGQDVDARTDIWSVGVILYEMVAGRTPFAAQSHSDVLAAILEHEPDPLVRFDPHVPAELQRIIGKALRKDRTQRYQSTSDFLLDLQALRDQPVSSSSTSRASDRATSVPSSRRWSRRAAVAAAAVILLGGGAAGWRFWSGRNAPNRTAATTTRAEPRPATRLTFAPGLQTDVTFSPDGRFIAYASDQGGNFDIWVQPVEAAGTPVRVTQSPAADTEPDWSPDGKQIVFRSERDGGGLFLVPALGGPERRISAFGARPKWSPDGSRIAFASDPQQFAAGLTFYLVGTDGRAPVPVPQARVEDGRQLVGGCWHPDGRLTFLTDTAAGRVLHTRTVENPAAVITTLPPALRNVGVANFTSECTWTPSADALLFEISTNNISHLWRLDVDTKSLAARALTQVSFGAGQDRRHALSRDGAKIAFSTVSDDIRLWLYSLDRQSGLIRGEPEPLTDPSAALPVTGELSPDGRRLVFPVTGIGTGQWELRVKDLQSGSSVRLFSDGHGRFLPHWSSDGTSLVYQRVGGGSARQELAIQRRPGGDEEVLAGPESGFITSHGWSPDGRAILVSWARGGPNPVLAFWPVAAAPHADRAAETIVADAAYGLWQGRISPNGRWLSFGAAASGKALVCIVPSDAHAFAFKRWNCVSDPRVWTDKPRWSSDGRFLYVWRRSGSMFNVWAVPFDDRQGSVRGTPFQVTHFDGPAHRVWADELSLAEPSVAADRMLLPVVHATGSVWLIENGAK